MLRISEVLPAPREAFSSEWVELYNPGPDAVPLDGWSLDDSADGAAQPLDGLVIAPGALLVVELRRPILNNGGDTARLLGPGGEAVDELAFGATGADRSVSRDLGTGETVEDGEPSPGRAPLLAAPPAASAGGEPQVARTSVAPGQERPAPPGVAPGSSLQGDEAPQVRPAPEPVMRWRGTPGPAPTYRASAAVRYVLAPSATATSAPPPATPAAAAATVDEAPALWPALAGLGLIVTACALLVVDRKPWKAGGGDRGVL
jgi:hypothetical protein